jgi:hypothetical protein
VFETKAAKPAKCMDGEMRRDFDGDKALRSWTTCPDHPQMLCHAGFTISIQSKRRQRSSRRVYVEPIIAPASQTKVWPVTSLEPESRLITAAATSSGWQTVFIAEPSRCLATVAS